LGTAEDLYGRTARGIQITARIVEQSTCECLVADGRPRSQRRRLGEAKLVDAFVLQIGYRASDVMCIRGVQRRKSPEDDGNCDSFGADYRSREMIDGRAVDKPVDRAQRGRLRAFYEWLKPATPPPYLPSSQAGAPDRGNPPARVGHTQSSAPHAMTPLRERAIWRSGTVDAAIRGVSATCHGPSRSLRAQ
jgi:hypothetical protein